jgi:hypothetical protein
MLQLINTGNMLAVMQMMLKMLADKRLHPLFLNLLWKKTINKTSRIATVHSEYRCFTFH